jgi:acyl carrier protein
MSMDEIKTIVCEILSTTLKRTIEPHESVFREQEEHWDSLKHVEIVLNLESAFNIQFTEEEMAELNSLAQIVESVEHHLET